MSMHFHAALITLLTVLLLAVATYFVGRARGKYQIHAPATTGHPDFERAFRAHQNTVESVVMFLPCLWIASLYCDERIAGWLGFAWIAARAWYLFGYIRAAGNRSWGYTISTLINVALLLMGLWCLLPPMVSV